MIAIPVQKAAKAAPLTPEEIDALEPIVHGVCWRKNEDGSWYLPERSLGWQIAEWCADYLRAKDGGPWKFTLEQLRFVLWWYAVDDDGVFVYRTGVLQRMKGHGKDPLLAVICLVEFVGPCRLGGWSEDGEPIGVPHPDAWVQVTAVSRDQTKNTMSVFPSLMSEKLISTYGIKVGAELFRADNGRKRLEAVTSNYRSLEGGRATFTVLNETQHWVAGSGGHQMYETIDGNLTKTDSRYLAITNAYLPGEDSVAQRMREAYEGILEGKNADVGFLYDSIEAHPKTPLTPEALRIVIPKIRGDSVWLNIESIIKSIQTASIAPSRSRRMWLNQIVADEDALISLPMWTAIENRDAELVKGDSVVLGFDGGKSDDATALVAVRTTDATAFLVGLWEKPDGPKGDGWEVDKGRVDSAIHEAFRLFDVKAFYADVAYWESYIGDWEETYGDGLSAKASDKHPIAWDMRGSLKRKTQAHERLLQAITDRKVFHDGDRRLGRHAQNAFRDENNFGVYFTKESRESPRKVDAYAALMLAHEALYDFRTGTSGRQKAKQKTGRGWFL